MTDLVMLLISIVLVSILIGPGSLDMSSIKFQTSQVLGSRAAISSNEYISFAMDRQYWDANCSHGWSSDSTCDNIVIRAQTCSTQITTTYCSDYKEYMKQFHNQIKRIQS